MVTSQSTLGIGNRLNPKNKKSLTKQQKYKEEKASKRDKKPKPYKRDRRMSIGKMSMASFCSQQSIISAKVRKT